MSRPGSSPASVAKRKGSPAFTRESEVSWRVGYEDAAFFRRLFKRVTGMAPGAYRKRFRIPDFARVQGRD